MTTETLDAVAANTTPETVTSLDDVAAPVGGAWPNGWYAATVLEGYSNPKGKVFQTGDGLSKKGDSRNFIVCLKLVGATGERNVQDQINYRPSDFAPERIAFVKQQREEHKGVQGRWHDDPDAQRSSLALAKVGQVEKALGSETASQAIRNADGFIVASLLVGKSVDVRITTNKDGFNEVAAYDKPGKHVKR